MRTSTLRSLVDQELHRRGTDLVRYVAEAASEGRSKRATAADLARLTGIPFAERSFYRWVDDITAEVAS